MTYVHAFRLTLIGILGAALIASGLLATAPPADAFKKGSFYKAQVAAERNKCKKVKGKARRSCERAAEGKATAATNRAMKGNLGLYGHNLKSSQIPSTSGTLIWSKQLPTNEGAGRTDFVLYSSKSFPGDRKITVSGTVSVPEGAPPAGGWPVISWAHGTTGIADQCAPSLGGDQGSYGGAEPLIANWLENGYAVVATDYEGLGTNGIHPYLIGESEGRGVVDIVKAGRQLDPRLANSMVISGHSQGGHAALFAAEIAPTWGKGINHLGTIPYAPPANLGLQASGIGAGGVAVPAFEDQYGLSALAMMILRGMAVLDPAIDPDELLLPAARDQWDSAAERCLGEDADDLPAAFAGGDIDPYDLLRQGWQGTPSGQALLNALADADPAVETNGPTLILQGLQDTTVQPGLTTTLVSQLRGINGPSVIEYFTYGNAGNPNILTEGPSTHSSILLDSLAEADAFLASRFGLAP